VELSYLSEEEQWEKLSEMSDAAKRTPKPKAYKVSHSLVRSFFHTGVSREDIEKTIERALSAWFENGGDIG